VWGALDTLDNLKKGGRIGGAKAMLASALSIKPIIEVRDGRVEQGGKQRTRSRALAFLVEKLRSYGDVENLAVLQADCDDVDQFVEMLRPHFGSDIVIGDMGPVETLDQWSRVSVNDLFSGGASTSVHERNMSTATSPPPLPPAVLAHRYRLERRLAQGGMAEIWLGTDLSLTRQVAIKVLKPALACDPVVAERFRREAIAVAQLSHPNIVAVYDAIEDNGRQAVVMQLVNGKSLRQLLDEQKRLSPDLTMHIGTCVAAALDAAHRAGMVHRDVKPGNILITPDGRVLLTDFGIAKGLEPSGDDLTSDNIMMGTAKYLSPEQVRGKRLDGRADLYSLGLVLYECLAGRVPFLGQTDADTALARLQRDPTDITRLRPTLPHGLAAVIHRLLARRPDDRFSSGAAVKVALYEVSTRAHDPTVLDQTSGTKASDRTPADPDTPRHGSFRKPIVNGATADGRVADRAGAAPTRAVTPIGGYQPVRTPGRPAGAPVRVDRDRTPTGRNRVQQRPNRKFEHRRSPSLVVVGGLLLAALVVSMLLWNTLSRDTPDDIVTPDGAAEPAASTAVAPDVTASTTEASPAAGTATRVASVAVYDPEGDGTENDADAPKAADANAATAWSTSCYSSEYFGGKRGVGVVATLDGVGRGTVRVDLASAPWLAEVYASDAEQVPAAIADWGTALASDNALTAGTVEVTLTAPARHVLVLLRQGGRSGCPNAERPHRGSISEIGFEATP